MHQKALLREEGLKQEIKEKDGQIRDLKNRLFGKKSEKKTSKTEKADLKSNPDSPKDKKPRGQQPGSEGHGLTDRPDLPVVDEQACFPENPVCPCCGLPYTLDGSTGPQTQIIEVEVKAYTRRIVRQTGTKTCSCKGVPQTITAPMPPKLMPKSPYGISIWTDVLLNKFHYCQPTNRLLDLTVLSNAKYKILTSLKNHWDGLSVFVEHPEVPMDNNKGENAIWNPVTGRKNFYGSGSVWSAQLAAIMFSIFKTLDLWGLNCHHWLNSYLNACAVNHGKSPEDLSPFLPWEMDEARLDKLSKPLDTS